MINREATQYIKRAISTRGVSHKLEGLREHHPPSFAHSFRTAYIAAKIALIAEYNPPDIQFNTLCALLHDLGKCRIPASILSAPRGLTPEERYTINNHPRYGHAMLADFNPDVAVVSVAHHEPFIDGHPRNERRSNQDELRPIIELVGLADVVAALTEPTRIRPYRGIPFTQTETIDLLKQRFTGNPTLIDVVEYLMAIRTTTPQL